MQKNFISEVTRKKFDRVNQLNESGVPITQAIKQCGWNSAGYYKTKTKLKALNKKPSKKSAPKLITLTPPQATAKLAVFWGNPVDVAELVRSLG